MIKIKKIIKWFFLIIILIVVALIGFIILTETGVIKLPKDPIPMLQETKFEKINEWYDEHQKCQMIEARYTFDGLNGVGYYQQKLANKENIGSFELMTIQERLESQLEPSNLVCYIKNLHPFDRWNKDGDTYNHTTANGFKFSRFDKEDDSQLYLYVKLEKQQHEGPGNNKLIVKYQGPKHFLEEDKDYYLGRARVSDSNFELTNFHLHFNPIRKTLSIFKDKHHVKLQNNN